MTMVNITILCATRLRLLKQTLDSIGDLSNATVTIRDCAMSEDVGRLVEQWCDDRINNTGLLWDNRPMGTGPSRNLVIRKSEEYFGRGEFLYIGDDDTYFLRPDWLSVLVDAYRTAKEYGYKAIAAYNHPYNGPIQGEPWVRCGEVSVYPVYAIASQSMLMSWDVWEEFGPFCDTPAGKVCQSEDVAFSNKIREAGYKVGVISPALLVNTGITNSFGEKIPGWEAVLREAPEGVVVE